MELKALTKEALLARGMNGLNSFDHNGCACHVDDLMPCGEPSPSCKGCVLVSFGPDCKIEDCEWSGDDHWHLAPSADEVSHD